MATDAIQIGKNFPTRLGEALMGMTALLKSSAHAAWRRSIGVIPRKIDNRHALVRLQRRAMRPVNKLRAMN